MLDSVFPGLHWYVEWGPEQVSPDTQASKAGFKNNFKKTPKPKLSESNPAIECPNVFWTS